MRKLAILGVITAATIVGCGKNAPVVQEEVATDSIIASPNDNREYKSLTLENSIDVILVSDPKAEKSAAALSVGVGLLKDPMTQQGMAHYLEHMLFLGTERFPDTKGYSEFMTKNGGAHNAYTWLDITNYMFKINNSAYDEALDRFSDFFKSPKLYPEYTDKEKNAVNAEWSMRREMDFFGQFKLARAMMGEHPANRFLIGNLETLSDKENSKLHPETVAFFNKYYSANIMKVAMISNQPIAEMEALAKKHFANIPNKNIEKPVTTETVSFTDIGKKRVHYVPNEDVKELTLDFTIENNASEFAVKPNRFISSLIGSEMPGTPAFQLKEAGLIAGLNAYASPNMYGNYGTFTIGIELTDAGVQSRELIVATVMRYIDMVKEKGVDEKYFSEIKTSLNNQFKFLEKQDEFGYVSNLAASMQEVPSEYAIAAPYHYDHFDAGAINKVLAQLTPERLRIWYIGKEEPHDSELHFYDGKYQIADISEQEIASWKETSPFPLNLPAVNRLLPENFDLVEAKEVDKPQVVIDTDKLKAWHYPSQLFASQPRGELQIYFNSPMQEVDIKAAVLQSIWVDLFNLQQSALSTEAGIAGMNLSFSSGNGLTLSISGFTDKQSVLLEEALLGLKVKVTEEQFSQAIDRYVRNIRNQGKQFPFYQAFDAYRSLVRVGEYNAEQLIETAESLTAEALFDFQKTLFGNNQLRLFAFGNYTTQSIEQAADAVLAFLPEDRRTLDYDAREFWKPTPNKTIVWQQDIDVADVAIVDGFIHPTPGFDTLAVATVLRGHFRNIAFDKLRTEEQLAYAVGGTSISLDDYTGFAMYIQTPVKDVADMQARFDKFKLEYKEKLDALTIEEFNELKESALITLKEPPKNLREEAAPLFSDWVKERYNFDSRQQLIDAVEKVSLEDAKNFYQQTALNPEAARVSIQMRGSKFVDKPFASLPNETIVKDLAEFHKAMEKQ